MRGFSLYCGVIHGTYQASHVTFTFLTPCKLLCDIRINCLAPKISPDHQKSLECTARFRAAHRDFLERRDHEHNLVEARGSSHPRIRRESMGKMGIRWLLAVSAVVLLST